MTTTLNKQQRRPVMFNKTQTRRVDGKPETAADRKFFDLRESGYTGWIDHNGNAVKDGNEVQAARGERK